MQNVFDRSMYPRRSIHSLVQCAHRGTETSGVTASLVELPTMDLDRSNVAVAAIDESTKLGLQVYSHSPIFHGQPVLDSPSQHASHHAHSPPVHHNHLSAYTNPYDTPFTHTHHHQLHASVQQGEPRENNFVFIPSTVNSRHSIDRSTESFHDNCLNPQPFQNHFHSFTHHAITCRAHFETAIFDSTKPTSFHYHHSHCHPITTITTTPKPMLPRCATCPPALISQFYPTSLFLPYRATLSQSFLPTCHTMSSLPLPCASSTSSQLSPTPTISTAPSPSSSFSPDCLSSTVAPTCPLTTSTLSSSSPESSSTSTAPSHSHPQTCHLASPVIIPVTSQPCVTSIIPPAVRTDSDLSPNQRLPRPAHPCMLDKPYCLNNIALFRADSGEECQLPQKHSSSAETNTPVSPSPLAPSKTSTSVASSSGARIPDVLDMDALDDPLEISVAPTKPRISSVTDTSVHTSPDATRTDCASDFQLHSPPRHSLPVDTPRPRRYGPPRLFAAAAASLHVSTSDQDTNTADEDNDDVESTYSHASAINLDDLDDDDLAALRLHGANDTSTDGPVISRKVMDLRRQSFANSFAKARAKSRRAMVAVKPELQPHNEPPPLLERCVRALSEALDMNLLFAKSATERFIAFSMLYSSEERQVIADLLRETSMRLRNEAPTPWRSPIWNGRRSLFRNHRPQDALSAQSSHHLAARRRIMWTPSRNNALNSDHLVRSVVYGAHVIPSLQSAESILLRMAGEFHREEVTRRANRAERVDVPLSFAMTLTAALATFARLECCTTYSKYRSRNATSRRNTPHALLWLKTKYDGVRLSFGVTLHGESPCTVLFRRPRIFSLKKIDDYTTLVTEARDILVEFGQEVVRTKE